MLTLILPVRDWPLERVLLCIRSFQSLDSDYLSEIIVIDFGSETPLLLPDIVGVRVERLEASVWSLSEAINAGVMLCDTPLIAKTDADILISGGSRAEFDRMVRSVERQEIGLAMAQATDLPAEYGPAEAYDLVCNDRQGIGRLRPKWGQGGLVVFSRAVWDEIGGFESRFTGWGNEDNDFAERVRRAGKRTLWADRQKLSIFHVWHPPSFAATGVLSQRQENQRIAKDDKSVLRAPTFRHSNLPQLVAPNVLRTISPLVTLGIATSARPGRDRMIVEAIDSFRGQIDNDFEVLVVDNGSSWEDSARLKRAIDEIEWLENARVEIETQASIPRTRNIISDLSRGRYICVVDDDDLALPNRLSDHLRPFSRDGGIHGSHGGWIDFDESTGLFERNQGKARSIATLLKGTGKITAHPASLYRADVLRAVRYDESYALGSDFDLALRLANSGFDVAHTGSYLTLRRYHSTNVTITGQANQVSNGAAARARTLSSFDWQKFSGLEQAAKTQNSEIYCRNQLSLGSLFELLPDYVGVWQVFVPLGALTQSATGEASSVAGLPSIEPPQGLGSTILGERPLLTSGSQPSVLSTLQQLLEIVDGDICTRKSGLNQPIFFRSGYLEGVGEARRVKKQVEDLLGQPIVLSSVRQAELDRNAAFDWRAMGVASGERVLQSPRFDDLVDLLETFAGLGADTLLTAALSLVADHDAQGEAYYLVSGSIKGLGQLERLQFDLNRILRMPFQQIGADGSATDLLPNSRTH